MSNKDSVSETTQAPKRRFIALRAEHSVEEITIEAPADQPVHQLIPDMLKVLGWPDSSGDHTLIYELRTEAGELLDADESLEHSGVENSDVLWIQLAEGEQIESLMDGPNSAVASSAQASPSPTRTESPRSAPAPPIEANIEIDRPSLVSKEGLLFEISDPPVMVGRAGRNFVPEIDLTDLDPEFVSSRRHARVEIVDGKILISALRTTNGTFINGFELSPGAKHELASGDEVQFGFEGVKLHYFPQGQRIPASFFS